MDLSIPGSTPNSPLVPVFGDNVQDLLGTGALNVNPSAIITVNSIADTVDDLNSGVTTLRDAVNQANGDTGEDLIVFDRSLFSTAQTITLSQGELDLTHNLDIIAPRDSLTGADLVTVSGNKASRVFEIESGATVSLNGLIVGDGLVINDDGGGIKNSGNLTLDSSIVRNNSTGNQQSTPISIPTDSARNGGGIFNGNDANLTVSNSTISNNSVFSLHGSLGGGIYNIGGTVTVSNSTLSGNSVRVGSFGTSSGDISGGGIYNTDMGIVTVIDSTIKNNSVSGVLNANRGGGISNEDGIVTVSNSTLSDNSVSGFSTTGGGIYNSGTGTLTVNNSTISGNSTGRSSMSSSEGGGIFNDGGTVTVNNSILSGNIATSGNQSSSEGGGIFNDGGTVTVNNSILSGNLATSANQSGTEGGGIFNDGGTVTVNNSTLSSNSADGDYGDFGGGIYNMSGILTVSNSTISGNLVGRGSIFGSSGGGIYNNGGTVTLVFSTLTGNQAENGGGVYNALGSSSSPPGSVNARNTIIAGNKLSTNGVNPDVSGTFTSNGYNLIGDSTGSTGFGATGDIVGTSDNPIDPRLAPLDFNGGSTQTLALLPDSPAIGAGDPTVLDTDPTTDQRGLPRRALDGSTDIGAFEFSS